MPGRRTGVNQSRLRRLGAVVLQLGLCSAGARAGAIHFVDVAEVAGVNHTHGRLMVAPNCLFVAVDRSVADHDDQDPLLLFDPSVRPSMQLLANRAFVDHIASGILRADDGGSCQEERNSGGVAIGDADGDGRPDLLFSRLHGGPVLYRNLGNGSFEDVTLASGLVFVDEPHDLSGRPPACTSLASSQLAGGSVPTAGVYFVDVDNDGDEDIFVTSVGGCRHALFINDGAGHFQDETLARGAGVTMEGDRSRVAGTSVAIGDYDRDGYLDLFVAEWRLFYNRDRSSPTGHKSNSRLLRNRGRSAPGYFEDVTEAAGLAQEARVRERLQSRWVTRNRKTVSMGVFSFAPLLEDLDLDGWPDLLIVGDFATTLVFWNNGNGTFSEDGHTLVDHGLGLEENGMGLAVGDVDRDGRPDLFVTGIRRHGEQRTDAPFGTIGNFFYHNRGDRRFEGRIWTRAAGVEDAGWGWGTALADLDNDGDLDLFVANGYVIPETTYDDEWNLTPTRLWQNPSAPFLGDTRSPGEMPAWENVAEEAGVASTKMGRGVAVGDLNDDGKLDVVVANFADKPAVFLSRGPQDKIDGVGGDETSMKAKEADEANGVAATKTTTPGTNPRAARRASRPGSSAFDDDLEVEVVRPQGCATCGAGSTCGVQELPTRRRRGGEDGFEPEARSRGGLARFAATTRVPHSLYPPHFLRVDVREEEGGRASVGARVRVDAWAPTPRDVMTAEVVARGGAEALSPADDDCASVPRVLSQFATVGTRTGFQGQSESTAHFGLSRNLCAARTLNVTVEWFAGEPQVVVVRNVQPDGVLTVVRPPNTRYPRSVSRGSAADEALKADVPVLVWTLDAAANGTEVAATESSASEPAAHTAVACGRQCRLRLVNGTQSSSWAQVVESAVAAHARAEARRRAGGSEEGGDEVEVTGEDAERLLPLAPIDAALERVLWFELFQPLDPNDPFPLNRRKGDPGMAHIPLSRCAPFAYADEIASPAGPNRPSARVVSNELMMENATHPAPRPRQAVVSDLHAHFGQFLSHDLSHTVPEANTMADSFFPIPVPAGDPIFDPEHTGQAVLRFRRSIFDSSRVPREQINRMTAYLDGSVIYGTALPRLQDLRAFEGGRLRETSLGGMPFNARSLPNDNPLARPVASLRVAGDPRVNIQPGLHAVHALWVREHNTLARHLERLWRAARTAGLLKDRPLYRSATALARETHQSSRTRDGRSSSSSSSSSSSHRRRRAMDDEDSRPWELFLDQLEGPTLDEFLFQKARRIVVAELQLVTWKEYLPSTLGFDVIAPDEEVFQDDAWPGWQSDARSGPVVPPQASGFPEPLPPIKKPSKDRVRSREPQAAPRYRGWDPKGKPGICNEFSTAAFRFGHSQAGDHLTLANASVFARASFAAAPHSFAVPTLDRPTQTTTAGPRSWDELPAMRLNESYFMPLHERGALLDDLLRGMVLRPALPVDELLADHVRNFLFGSRAQGGLDLAAINIQRGRDHGLADWNATRVALGLPPVPSAVEFARGDAELAERLTRVLGPELADVDLFVGGLLESRWAEHRLLGPTFAELLKQQFVRIRDADRWWYANGLLVEERTALALEPLVSLRAILERNLRGA